MKLVEAMVLYVLMNLTNVNESKEPSLQAV